MCSARQTSGKRSIPRVVTSNAEHGNQGRDHRVHVKSIKRQRRRDFYWVI